MADGEDVGRDGEDVGVGGEAEPGPPGAPGRFRRRTGKEAAQWVLDELTRYHDLLAGSGTPAGERRAQGLEPGIAAARGELGRLEGDPAAATSEDTGALIEAMLAALPAPSGDEDVDLGLQYAVATIKACGTELPS